MPRPVRLLILATFVYLSLCASTVRADNLVIGGGEGFNRFPFGVDTTAPNYQVGAIYQQFYSRAEFSGPLTITQIAFASAAGIGTSGSAVFDFELRLGTATKTLSRIEPQFAANRGPDMMTVFTGPLLVSLGHADAFDLVINLTRPFTYHPGRGDLLLEVKLNAPTSYTGEDLYFVAGEDFRVARVYSVSPGEVGVISQQLRYYGLQTRFESGAAAIPEPATLTMLGSGLAVIIASVRRRRRS